MNSDLVFRDIKGGRLVCRESNRKTKEEFQIWF